MTRPRLFLVWSIEHDAWWKPGKVGYTRRLAEAGRYAEDDARAILARANFPPGRFNEALVPVEAVAAEPPSIACPICGATSYNPLDILERYCGRCHAFHDDPPSVRKALDPPSEV